jgi:splicing factor 1
MSINCVKIGIFFILDSRDSDGQNEPRRKKKRASRWGDTNNEKTVIPGMPSILPNNLTKEQEKAYISRKFVQQLT